MHVAPFQAEDGFPSGQEAENPYSTHGLAENSGKCGTFYAHAKGKNKDRIQDNVDNSTDNCSHHTYFGKSLSCNEGIHAQYDQYKKASEDIDSGIICCIS